MRHQVARVNAARALVAALALLAAAALGGCGSVTTTGALNDAERQLNEARGIDADKYAVYEYTRADVYFQKAKKLAGEGQFEQASEYARASQNASEKSIDVARLNKDREARRAKFAPKPKDEAPRKVPSFTPGGE